LAARTKAPADSRIWDTLPAEESASREATVWIESTMTASGAVFSISSRMFSKCVCAYSKSRGDFARRRAARMATCRRDSSPET